MQKLDTAASEHCLGQAEPTENPVCVLEGGIRESAFGSQCPLWGCRAKDRCLAPLPFIACFSAQGMELSSYIPGKCSVTEPHPSRATLAQLSHSGSESPQETQFLLRADLSPLPSSY